MAHKGSDSLDVSPARVSQQRILWAWIYGLGALGARSGGAGAVRQALAAQGGGLRDALTPPQELGAMSEPGLKSFPRPPAPRDPPARVPGRGP